MMRVLSECVVGCAVVGPTHAGPTTWDLLMHRRQLLMPTKAGSDRRESDEVGQRDERVDVVAARTDGVDPERLGGIRCDIHSQVVRDRVGTVVELQDLRDLYLNCSSAVEFSQVEPVL